MTYIEFDFSKFYYPLQKTDDGWVFGFLRKRRELEVKINRKLNLSEDQEFMDNLLKNVDKQKVLSIEDLSN
jgi:hypothetical protein